MKTNTTFNLKSILEDFGCPTDCVSWCEAFMSEQKSSESSQSTPDGTTGAENAAGPAPIQMEDCIKIMEEFMRSCSPDCSVQCGSTSDDTVKHDPVDQ